MAEPTFTAAVVASTSVLSGVLGVLAQYLRMRPLVAVTHGRHAALAGTWRGRIDQPDQPAGYTTANVVMNFRTRGKRLIGDATVSSRPPGLEPVELKLKMLGGQVRDSIIRLDYANAIDQVMQFGTFYIVLDPDGENMNGRFAGYGNKAGGITHGHLTARCELRISR